MVLIQSGSGRGSVGSDAKLTGAKLIWSAEAELGGILTQCRSEIRAADLNDERICTMRICTGADSEIRAAGLHVNLEAAAFLI